MQANEARGSREVQVPENNSRGIPTMAYTGILMRTRGKHISQWGRDDPLVQAALGGAGGKYGMPHK